MKKDNFTFSNLDKFDFFFLSNFSDEGFLYFGGQ